MGNKSPPTTTSTTKQELSPEQRQIINLAMPSIKEWAGSEYPFYDGSTVAGFTPEQTQAQQGYVAGGTAGQALGGQAGQSQQFMLGLDQLNPGSNPYISAIADQITGKMTEGLLQQTLPAIRGGAIQGGGMYGGGSTRQGLAEVGAVNAVADQTGNALERLYFDNYNTGLNNIARAQQLNPSIQSQQLFGANILDAVGSQKQAMEQALLNEQLQKWAMETYGPLTRSQELMGLLGMMPNNGAVTATSQGALPKANPLTSGLGGAASGAAIGSAIPVLGTGLGAVLGGLAGIGGSFL